MSHVKNLKYERDGFTLNIPSMELSDNGVTALVGRSGCGKSTLVRILIGLEKCQSVEWLWQGDKSTITDLAKMPIPERRLGVVFQNADLFPHLSAEENIRLTAEARKIANAEQKVNSLIEQLELQECRKRQAKKLSGGEAQRVALARALAGEPRFLFLDEPFSALDPQTRDRAHTLLRDVLKAHKTPVLLVTHDEKDIQSLAQVTYEIVGGTVKKK